MQYTKLGRTGLTVSRICLGCGSYGSKTWQPWVIEQDEARDHYARALESGINFFDTADMYSNGVSEQITGRYLKEMGRRDELVVTSKVYGLVGEGALRSGRGDGPNRSGLGRKHILDACDASLRRLGMDYIDSVSNPSVGLHDSRPRRFSKHWIRWCGPVRRVAARRQQHQGLGVCQGPVYGARAWMARVCFDAEPLQSGLSRGRA